MLRALALCSHPVEGAATRFRVSQFVEPLAAHGIELTLSPFLDAPAFAGLYDRDRWLQTTGRILLASAARVFTLVRASKIDILLIQREAMLFGPPLLEFILSLRVPTVLDLDDATYLAPVSPTYGPFATLVKWPWKTDQLIKRADAVIAGSNAIAAYAAEKNRHVVVMPTIVDTDVFTPLDDEKKQRPTIGWIGTHSTFRYLQSIFPVFEELARTHDFTLKIVGAGKDDIRIPGVNTEVLSWDLHREVADFQSLDIGVYPLAEDAWSAAKAGLKAIQYMAVGIPFVATPVGGALELGERGTTHFLARSKSDWITHLGALLRDPVIRKRMGEAGRSCAVRNYNFRRHASRLADILTSVASGAGPVDSSPGSFVSLTK